jgi:hypothetical protein
MEDHRITSSVMLARVLLTYKLQKYCYMSAHFYRRQASHPAG